MAKVTASFTMKSLKDQVLKASDAAVERGLEAIGMQSVTLTHRDKEQGGTPVDTGRLRNSIAWATEKKSGGGSDGQGGGDASEAGKADKYTVVIGTNVEYAESVEEGSSKRKAYHMLRNAINDEMDEKERIMRASLEAAKE